VNSFLSILDLVNTLNGMLPHIGVLHIIRYKNHRGTGEEEHPWCKEAREGKRSHSSWCKEEGRRKKKKRRRKREEEAQPAQSPVRPGPRPTCPVGDRSTGSCAGLPRLATG
jgi:hypothetical protein